MPWKLHYEAAFPAAPNPVTVGVDASASEEDCRNVVGAALALPGGCYYLEVSPLNLSDNGKSFIEGEFRYEGPLRVEWDGIRLLGSGDLYAFRAVENDHPPLEAPWKKDLLAGIPVFPRRFYRYYVRLTGATLIRDEDLQLRLRLTLALLRFSADQEGWVLDETLTVEVEVPSDGNGAGAEPGSDDRREQLPRLPGQARSVRLQGPALNPRGHRVADVIATWVSPYLRRARLRIFCSNCVKPPLQNGRGLDWQRIYDQVGWELAVDASPIPEDEDRETWNERQLHDFMLKARREIQKVAEPGDAEPLDAGALSLDEEWRYFLLCVQTIEREATQGGAAAATHRPFGIMYDAGAYDDDGIPREGAAIAAGAVFGNEKLYGAMAGQALGSRKETYFRTAVHEIGHAQNLAHNPFSAGFMQQTRQTAQAATLEGKQFPDGIPWHFALDDAHRLRHMPDPWVRPGGLSFLQGFLRAAGPEEDWIEEAQGVTLRIDPDEPILPLGAPLRLRVEITAQVPGTEVPEKISLKAANLRGKVIDASGVERVFSPAVIFAALQVAVVKLGPGQTISQELVLLRGGRGPLLPAPGRYEVEVEVEWDTVGEKFRKLRLRARAGVLVVGPSSRDLYHAKGALAVLEEPKVMEFLVLNKAFHPFESTADEISRGTRALKAALASSVLKGHYAGITVPGLLDNPSEASLELAKELLEASPHLTFSELGRVQRSLTRLKERYEGDMPVLGMAETVSVEEKTLHSLETTVAALEKKLLDERQERLEGGGE